MRRQKGQGLLEFALIVPVLLLILLGIIEAALVIQGYITVQHAAREAARFAVTYQPVQGKCLYGTLAPYPACPEDYAEWPWEPDAHYYARRVELIKQEARRAATGLRIAHLGDTLELFQQYGNEPGFFGVRVWGYPSFQTNCNDSDLWNKPWSPSDSEPGCLEHPGLEGLPVLVLVKHNVEILDPLYRAIVEYVPVQANTQMINEGIQVGFGDVPPGSLDFNPDPDEPPLPTVTPNPDEPMPTVVPPLIYHVTLHPESAINTMPGDREHRFVATVTDELSRTVQGARVSFSTDVGGFSYSGVGPQYVETLTGAGGRASVTLFGNGPGTARLRAWLDYDGDNAWDPGEPFDEATKRWEVEGPYIVVSDHEVYPEIDFISIDVMAHATTGNPYSLWWCVISGTNTSTVVQGSFGVGPSGNWTTEALFQIPADSEGVYQLETHPAVSDGCGEADRVAYSARVRAVVLPPDLSIASFQVPDLICPKTVFTMSAVITNSSPGSTDEVFDVDFYADPVSTPPPGPIGIKQWVSGIGPYGTAVVNTLMWVESESPGEHTILARVDTSNYVDEGSGEGNNASMITITTGSLLGEPGDTGRRGPTANEAGDNGGFSNPGGAYANDSSRAYRDNNANNVSHVYRNYGFNLPADVIVQGIQVRLDWWLDSTSGANSIGVYLSWDGGNSWTAGRTASTERTGDGNPTDIVGGLDDTWGRTWDATDFSNSNFRVRLVLQTDSAQRDFRIDWVPVRVVYNMPGECEIPTPCQATGDPRPWCEPEIKPPGLVECQQLLRAGGFEGNPETVYAHWHAGEPYAYKHQSQYFYEGSMSMRLHASLSPEPGCDRAYQPYLWQAVTVPTDVYTLTTMVVQGQWLVTNAQGDCNTGVGPEAGDVLYMQMQDGSGNPLGGQVEVGNGGGATGTWAPFVADVTGAVGLAGRQGQQVHVYFAAQQTDNITGTWFYLDALRCDVCTKWPVPEPVAGTATIAGGVRVLVGGIPRTLQGVDVWAYSQGGEVYHTVTIQDGTYGFYNIPPGFYTIYSETWVGGGPRSAMTTLMVGANERRYHVNLFLL